MLLLDGAHDQRLLCQSDGGAGSFDPGTVTGYLSLVCIELKIDAAHRAKAGERLSIVTLNLHRRML